MRTHNRKLRQTWTKFHKKHAQAVELEAAWAAAVRDSLSEEDQRKFDQQRMQQREMSKYSKGKASKGQKSAESRQEGESSSADNRQQQKQKRSKRQQAQPDSQTASARQKAEGQEAFGFVLITTASPERFTKGTSQSPQQKRQCSEACRKYKEKLTSIWSDLHKLHHDLVQIEAGRIQTVEQQLTEEQLTQLQEDRQEPAETASATSGSRQSR